MIYLLFVYVNIWDLTCFNRVTVIAKTTTTCGLEMRKTLKKVFERNIFYTELLSSKLEKDTIMKIVYEARKLAQ